MTDSIQELDVILALLGARMPQPKTMNEATARVAMLQETKKAVLDWHNKQIEAVLDRLESKAEWLAYDDSEGEQIKAVDISAIEAERTRLRGDDE